ncbi:MarR family winged helix-turn-helix transcriptional regulator [Imperialibacter roseus]|uniref:MarR family winged helix-turn-helix transcriptional regulator n=1 Tax=Imperialibacter roseus TaxID=1324217 RepID=A0ABZ0ILA9_9BACT|nr:MarR family winged helix-turn-helix transcriptional regulator [Imperialibacter roseus]WOK04780.1 MarR family winged helix-turn-helix transcriptional regulator [Imperialibacter roseus]|tara:strand:+ start:24202 stop:24639 length:438 start_codon:yes stop_codon:yes gene_type:complete
MIEAEKAIGIVRDFNRFYTSVIGLLDKHILDSPYSLSEARVMFEINIVGSCTARHIKAETQMDEGYLSRIVDKLLKQGLLKKTRSDEDGRAFLLSLSPAGQREFTRLDKASHDDIALLLKKLSRKEIDLLSTQLQSIKSILAKTL